MSASRKPAAVLFILLGSFACSRDHREAVKVISARPSEARQARRAQYPFSVVMGGVYSAEELSRARRIDRVVRDHYADFGENPEIKRIENDLLVYVSYRKRDRVYWTRAQHRVKRGETILTAGSKMARARCGNQLSLQPQKPTEAADEPAEDVLGTPEEPQLQLLSSLRPPDIMDADLYMPGLALPDKPAATPNAATPIQSFVNSPSAGAAPLNSGLLIPGFAGRAVNPPSTTAPASTGTTNDTTGGNSNGPVPPAGPPVVVPSYPPLIPPYIAVPEPDLSRVMWPILALGLVFLGIRKTAGTR